MAALTAANRLIALPLFQQSEHIACYLAYQHELDTLSLIQRMLAEKKYCYLPLLKPDNSLEFARYEYGDALRPNAFGIFEPLPDAEKIPANELDLVVMPLVAFDLAGHRLGTGGGYYDRTFGFISGTQSSKPYLLGFAYAAQQADFIPVEPWDVKMMGVVTEEKFLKF